MSEDKSKKFCPECGAPLIEVCEREYTVVYLNEPYEPKEEETI